MDGLRRQRTGWPALNLRLHQPRATRRNAGTSVPDGFARARCRVRQARGQRDRAILLSVGHLSVPDRLRDCWRCDGRRGLAAVARPGEHALLFAVGDNSDFDVLSAATRGPGWRFARDPSQRCGAAAFGSRSYFQSFPRASLVVDIQSGRQLSPGLRSAIPAGVRLVLELATRHSSAGVGLPGAGRATASPHLAGRIIRLCAQRRGPMGALAIPRRGKTARGATRVVVPESNRVAGQSR